MESDQEKPSGIIGKTVENGFPVIWKFVNLPPSDETRRMLPCLTTISWAYDGSTNNGLPPGPINQRMMLLEKTISEEIEAPAVCQHAISRTGNHMKELIYYIHDSDQFMKAFNAALRSHDRYPIEITFEEDPEWAEHAYTRSLFSKPEAS